jgi:hypothetical protein
MTRTKLSSSGGPLTRAETSSYRETSTHADVSTFILALREIGGERLCVSEFGTSPEGRSLPLLILSNAGHFTPADSARAGDVTVLIQCGIHAGEVEGKEAALMLARDLLREDGHNSLQGITLLIVPLFNPDGNDRIDPRHRILDIAHFSGQIGPAHGVGTRENAAGVNLNRDYLRQAGAEMRLMQTRVCHPWNPHLVVDCHTTNGSIHRFAMSVDVPHTVASGRSEPIEYMRSVFLPEVMQAVHAQDGFESYWYGNFQRDEGGDGVGWITYPHHPRFGANYRGLTNRLDLLLETYSYQSFETRVSVTYAFLRESIKSVRHRHAEILRLLDDCRMPPPEVAVGYRLDARNESARILTRDPYRLDGAPVTVMVPHFAQFIGERFVQRPTGYVVPPAVAVHLQGHGLTLKELDSATTADVEVAVVRGHVEARGRGILEAQSSAHLEVDWRRTIRQIPPGWRIVLTEQPRGAIAVYLCEPQSDDGLIECGLVQAPADDEEFPIWRLHGT